MESTVLGSLVTQLPTVMGVTLFKLAFIGFMAGIVSGASLGLFFHNEEWLGGYNSFRRRLWRLGHISFFGIGIVNLLIALSYPHLAGVNFTVVTIGMLVATITMPLMCLLSGWKKPFRHFFFIPVLGFATGVGTILFQMGS